jgi:hypothetical protein
MSCVKQDTKKYTERPSPPYPANECCGQVKVGNDGKLYRSVRRGRRSDCAWVRDSPAVSYLTKASSMRDYDGPSRFKTGLLEEQYFNKFQEIVKNETQNMASTQAKLATALAESKAKVDKVSNTEKEIRTLTKRLNENIENAEKKEDEAASLRKQAKEFREEIALLEQTVLGRTAVVEEEFVPSSPMKRRRQR